jgi:hypothetical protein
MVAEVIKVISSVSMVADIDLHELYEAINNTSWGEEFASIATGIEGISQKREQLLSIAQDGWRIVYREYKDAQTFIDAYIIANEKLVQMSHIDKNLLKRVRGNAGNSGGSDLLQARRDTPFYQSHKRLPVVPSMRNAVLDELLITDGDTACFDAAQINDKYLSSIVNDYMKIPAREGQQQRKEKSHSELVALLKKTAKKKAPENAVLIPRAIRVRGRVYVTTKKTVVSTNFYALYMPSMDEALILASWFASIFYQLLCEANAKPQEGPRKMEAKDIEAAYIPILASLSSEQKDRIITETPNIEFLVLNKPEPRNTDIIWAEILFGNDSDERLKEARRILEFLANARNPLALDDD